MKKRSRVSLISQLNIFRLAYRSALFLTAIGFYIYYKVTQTNIFNQSWVGFIVLGVITVLLLFEMVERFFPVSTSSMGSQKQFKRNYMPSGETKPVLQSWQRTMVVVLSWVALNLAIGTLYFLNIIDSGAMMLVALFYSVSDMICILFFCPFQTWMMKNRCCGTCRIYNWDFMMMTTPLIFLFIPVYFNVFTGAFEMRPVITAANPLIMVLVGTSFALFLRWEITYKLHPERFSDKTNMAIRCVNCKEKLCLHKKQLQVLLKDSKKLIKGFYDPETQNEKIG